ncbi:hypothetical protein [Velocimicrobium porci]|uniref:Uncharacterized protein n=1 Tax=Velocimicrobium porci TaxID=2606634 RepID=A0A6L5XV06_9FIRM|nr:hypothetical protein [Velocimicrobium porci]MSS62646.1 hypothetical protein [Velocimicrobium porci]
MMNLLVIKEQLRKFYSKADSYLNPAIKFISTLFIFYMINTHLGFNPKLTQVNIMVIGSFVCAFLPVSFISLVTGIVAVLQIFFVSKILAIVAAVILIIMYCMFLRFTPKYSFAVLAIPILFLLKIPYCIPILLGMIGTPIAVLPVSCGVVVFYLFSAIKESVLATNGNSVEDIFNVYRIVIDSLVNNKEMLSAILIFSVVMLVTYIVRKQSFDHAFEAGIVVGTCVSIIGFLIGGLGFDIYKNIGSIVIGNAVSGVLVYIIWFFRLSLDYTTVEKLQFEDDDYYYYVKAVPKMAITAPEKNIKRINPQKTNENTMNLQDVIQKGYSQDEIYQNRELEDDFDENNLGERK